VALKFKADAGDTSGPLSGATPPGVAGLVALKRTRVPAVPDKGSGPRPRPKMAKVVAEAPLPPRRSLPPRAARNRRRIPCDDDMDEDDEEEEEEQAFEGHSTDEDVRTSACAEEEEEEEEEMMGDEDQILVKMEVPPDDEEYTTSSGDATAREEDEDEDDDCDEKDDHHDHVDPLVRQPAPPLAAASQQPNPISRPTRRQSPRIRAPLAVTSDSLSAGGVRAMGGWEDHVSAPPTALPELLSDPVNYPYVDHADDFPILGDLSSGAGAGGMDDMDVGVDDMNLPFLPTGTWASHTLMSMGRDGAFGLDHPAFPPPGRFF
jgi:hypothetical protein